MPRVDFSTIEKPDKWLGASEVLDLYAQDEYWIDAYRERHQLTEMSHSYLMNVLKLLMRSARGHLSAAMLVVDAPGYAWMWDKPWETPLVKAVINEIRQREDPSHQVLEIFRQALEETSG
jgi:hypothetical protein